MEVLQAVRRIAAAAAAAAAGLESIMVTVFLVKMICLD
jgi:hypothetical protein